MRIEWRNIIKRNWVGTVLVPGVALCLIANISILLADRFVGEEEGVLLGYELADLMLKVNISIIAITGCIMLLLVVKKYGCPFIGRKSLKYAPEMKSGPIKNIIQSFIALLIIICLAELTFYFLRTSKIDGTESPYTYHDYVDLNFYRRDSILGIASNSNVTSQFRKFLVDHDKHDTLRIFDFTCSMDSTGKRSVGIPGMENRKNYAIFFGDSFTFGMGVSDSETFPHYFARNETDFCAYNFGFGGHGAQNMLAQLTYNNIPDQINQDSGVCFYTYTNTHVRWAIGDMTTIVNFGEDMPYYDYKDDSLVHYGSFKQNRKLVSGLYKIMSNSNFIKYLNISLPVKLMPRHYKLTHDLICKSYQEYKRQFKNDNFYVVLMFPDSRDIIEYLKNDGIKVIDLSGIFHRGENISKYLMPYDGHTTSVANELVANELIRAIHNDTRNPDSIARNDDRL